MAGRAAVLLALLVEGAGASTVAHATACLQSLDGGTCRSETAVPEESVFLQFQPLADLETGATDAETDSYEDVGAGSGCSGKKEKITVKLNGKSTPKTFPDDFPIEVLPGDTLEVSVCNSWNVDTETDHDEPPGDRASTALVGEVGAGAKVDIAVVNSGNLDVGGTLQVGAHIDDKEKEDIDDAAEAALAATASGLAQLRKTCPPPPDLLQRGWANGTAHGSGGRRESRAGRSGADGTAREGAGRGERRALSDPGQPSYAGAVIPTMVRGPVGAGASIGIKVRSSANINLKYPASEVYIKDASLVNSIITLGEDPLASAAVRIEVTNSGNVKSKKGGGKLVMVHPSCLTGQFARAGDWSDTNVVVVFRDSSNVKVGSMITSGELARHILYSRLNGEVSKLDFTVDVARVGKVSADSFTRELPAGFSPLVPTPVLMEEVTFTASKHQVTLSDVGSVKLTSPAGGPLQIFGGVYSVGALKASSKLTFRMKDCANLQAPGHVNNADLGLLQSVLLHRLEDSEVRAECRGSYTLRAGEVDVRQSIARGFFFLNRELAIRSRLVLKIDDSFNLYADRASLGFIIWDGLGLVDVHYGTSHSTLSVFVSKVANVRGNAGSSVCVERQWGGRFLYNGGYGPTKDEESKCELVVKNVAQVKAGLLASTYTGSIFSSIAWIRGDVMRTDYVVKAEGVANVEADKIMLHGTGLSNSMFFFPDVLQGSTVKLILKGSGKLSASEISLSDATLLSNVLRLEDGEDIPVRGSLSLDVTDTAIVSAKTSSIAGTNFVKDLLDVQTAVQQPNVKVTMVSAASLFSKKSAQLADESFLLGPIFSGDQVVLGSLTLMHTAMAQGKVDFDEKSRPCKDAGLATMVNTCVPKDAQTR